MKLKTIIIISVLVFFPACEYNHVKSIGTKENTKEYSATYVDLKTTLQKIRQQNSYEKRAFIFLWHSLVEYKLNKQEKIAFEEWPKHCRECQECQGFLNDSNNCCDKAEFIFENIEKEYIMDEEIEKQIQKFCEENNINTESLYFTSISYGSIENKQNEIIITLNRKY